MTDAAKVCETCGRGVAPKKRSLSRERQAITHQFAIGGYDGYITVGMYADGTPGEVSIRMAKEGSVVGGLMEAFATSVSMMLQYRIPLTVIVDKFSHMRFEPSGFTGNPEIPLAKSIVDYLARWLALKFLPAQTEASPAPAVVAHAVDPAAPACPQCGGLMAQAGDGFRCMNCGHTECLS